MPVSLYLTVAYILWINFPRLIRGVGIPATQALREGLWNIVEICDHVEEAYGSELTATT